MITPMKPRVLKVCLSVGVVVALAVSWAVFATGSSARERQDNLTQAVMTGVHLYYDGEVGEAQRLQPTLQFCGNREARKFVNLPHYKVVERVRSLLPEIAKTLGDQRPYDEEAAVAGIIGAIEGYEFGAWTALGSVINRTQAQESPVCQQANLAARARPAAEAN
jgi:hypothetical protein